ncbi:hypothetical protein KOR34_01180 [Posidoniimonas corsicana]|uniref:DUF2726 domain-containing protein n=1 Tax=Posidoniimonas corsicana TaxID=1938618 RepID=A0A5C5VB46_9BACT|nr:DUF2726 domain-containing protein [Posidoniimonas corsicana]TWT35230.1 hypothetical protein KOR34_01180 [Posidoniimonas corsicana]
MPRRSPPQDSQEKSPYTAQPRLISAGELRFYHTVLEPSFGNRFYIGVQVPMTAVLRVNDEQWDRAAGRRIRQKRLDFVLAYAKTFRVAAVVELDDLSHRDSERRRRDRFVGRALQEAGVLLIRIPVYRKYDAKRIRAIVNRRLREQRMRDRAGGV